MPPDTMARARWIALQFQIIAVIAGIPANIVWSESLSVSVRACRSQADEVQRLRCYDAAVDSLTPASMPSGPALDASRTSALNPVAPPISATSKTPATAAMAAPKAVPMYSAKVASLSFRPSGAVNLTLDNGQIWTQYGPEGRVPLRAGDTVTLRPGMFGASVLVGPSGWITKVHMISPVATDQ